MKRCQVCHFLADEKAPTCPKCGEASWTPGLVVEVRFGGQSIPDLTDAELEALTAPTTPTTTKKGKR